jgi:hypothetical protein
LPCPLARAGVLYVVDMALTVVRDNLIRKRTQRLPPCGVRYSSPMLDELVKLTAPFLPSELLTVSDRATD